MMLVSAACDAVEDCNVKISALAAVISASADPKAGYLGSALLLKRFIENTPFELA
jgi:hypothetical protein